MEGLESDGVVQPLRVSYMSSASLLARLAADLIRMMCHVERH